MKSYGIDFRKRVINYVEAGHSKKETCQLFGISTNTLYLWEKQLKELGHLERQKHTKISSEEISDGREYSLLFLYVKVEVSC